MRSDSSVLRGATVCRLVAYHGWWHRAFTLEETSVDAAGCRHDGCENQRELHVGEFAIWSLVGEGYVPADL